jgi:mannose-6-phosphate isomerase
MPEISKSLELTPRFIEKPWGRTSLPPMFADPAGRQIGEVWFEDPGKRDLPLLVKYIFTSEKLSIQVHPDDAQAAGKGLPRGKNECWYILDADEGATLGLGLKEELSATEIRSAALAGSIEGFIDWKPVAAGDFVYVPAGTIHAIGAGITLLEFQQNADVTYRLYDYGRPRELHLDEGIDVARATYDAARHFRPESGLTNAVLASGPSFSLVRADASDAIPDTMWTRRRWAMPLEGSVSAGEASVRAGGCLLVEGGVPLAFSPSALVLVGAEGSI